MRKGPPGRMPALTNKLTGHGVRRPYVGSPSIATRVLERQTRMSAVLAELDSGPKTFQELLAVARAHKPSLSRGMFLAHLRDARDLGLVMAVQRLRGSTRESLWTLTGGKGALQPTVPAGKTQPVMEKRLADVKPLALGGRGLVRGNE